MNNFVVFNVDDGKLLVDIDNISAIVPIKESNGEEYFVLHMKNCKKAYLDVSEGMQIINYINSEVQQKK